MPTKKKHYYLRNSVWRLTTVLYYSSFQDWFAFIGNGSEFNFTLSGEALFPNNNAPTAEDNYGFCQVRVFDTYRKQSGYLGERQILMCSASTLVLRLQLGISEKELRHGLHISFTIRVNLFYP